MKYDKIVEISKERSRQNTEVALRAIEEMLRERIRYWTMRWSIC